MRDELDRRPAVVGFLGLCMGLASGFQPTNALFGLVLLPALRARGWAVLAVSMALGFLVQPRPQPQIRVLGGVYRGPAVVIEAPQTLRSGERTVVEAAGRRYRVTLAGSPDVSLGDTVELDADIRPLREGSVPRRGETAELVPRSPVRPVHQGFVVWRWGMYARRSFLAFVHAHADPALIGLLDAVSLNVTADVSRSAYRDLQRSGTVHIVSASGFHVAIVSVFVAWALLASPLPRWAQLLVLACVLALYAAAAGLQAPMVRSVVMVLVGSFAYAFRREPDGLSALAVAGIVNLLWQPEDVASVGFQLSYLAVASLVTFGTVRLPSLGTTVWARLGDAAVRLGWTSVVVTVATMPLVAWRFGQVSLVSVLSNLLIVPVLPLVVVGVLASWLVWAVAPPVAVGLLKAVVEPLTRWVLAAVETTGRWPWASLETPPFSVYWVVAVGVFLALLWRPARRSSDSDGHV